ncbi:hypothetical protein AEAC466_13475 [Asticcacaulis sp. AC466]|uniref:hypothetical protein n=1 Tax=Asticcacaulis sp. AC466 TaxID=1282362 RepID=UPI0003C3B155|nr:hypothetical protein [Asticcacaulis sp. AC466]ESQ83257.1 hypothetical protein AEAC466_13475 [Asticcacaulis sp. AC466]
MDIAELGLKIKLQGADEALRALKAVRDEAGKAEAAIGRLEKISGRADGTLRQLVTGANKAEGAFRTLGNSLGNAGGAQSTFVSQVKDAEGIFRKAGDSLRGYQAELDHASQTQQSVGANVKTGPGPNKPATGHGGGAETAEPGGGAGVRAGGFGHGPGAQPGKAPGTGLGTGPGTGIGGGEGAGEALGTSLQSAGTGAEKSSRSFDKLNSTLFDMGKSMVQGEGFSTVLKGSALDLAQGALEASVGLDGLGVAALAANPVVWGVGAAAGVAAGAFMVFKSDVNKAADTDNFVKSLGLSEGQLKRLGDTSVTTGDMMTGLWNTADEAFHLKDTFDSLSKWVVDSFRAILDWGVKTWINLASAVGATISTIQKVFANVPAIVGDAFITGVNFAIKAIEGLVNKVIDGINLVMKSANGVLGALGQAPVFKPIEHVELGQFENKFKGTITNINTFWGDEFKRISGNMLGGMQAFLDEWQKKSIEARNERVTGQSDAIKEQDKAATPAPSGGGTAPSKVTPESETVAAASAETAPKSATVGTGDPSLASFATNIANTALTGGLGAAMGLNVAAGALANIAAAGAKVVNTASDAVATVNDGLAKTAESLHPVRDEIAGMGEDLAKAIVSGKSLGATFTDSLRKMAQEWMTSGIQKMFDALIGAKGSEGTGIFGGIFDKAGAGGGLGKVLKGLGGLFGLGKNAMGTDNWRGGPTWVGERGPEIVNLPRGAQVIPNHRIGAAAGGGAGGGPVEVRVHVDQDGNWQAAVGKIAGKVAGPIAQQAGSQAAMAGSQIAQSSMADRQRRSLRAV